MAKPAEHIYEIIKVKIRELKHNIVPGLTGEFK